MYKEHFKLKNCLKGLRNEQRLSSKEIAFFYIIVFWQINCKKLIKSFFILNLFSHSFLLFKNLFCNFKTNIFKININSDKSFGMKSRESFSFSNKQKFLQLFFNFLLSALNFENTFLTVYINKK